MIRLITTFFACLSITTGISQAYTSARIFAHNDYVRAIPFYKAHELQVGFIEADVFLHDRDLLVAHHQHEIEKEKTLEKLYLTPLIKQIRKNKGSVYANPKQRLTLMIDLKTEGVATLNKLVDILKKYPELITCSSLEFMISGNVPDPASWKNYPAFIHVDGRPGVVYTPDQLKRISMISTSFRNHSKWKGIGKLAESDHKKIVALMEEAHSKGKIFRFWATPDFKDAWQEQMNLKMDVIVTDDVEGLAAFLKQQKE